MRAIYSGNSEPPYLALLHIFPLDSLGLVACPLIWGSEPSDDKKLSEILNIKPHEKIVAWISAGYCPGKAFKAAISSKRDLNTILRIIE